MTTATHIRNLAFTFSMTADYEAAVLNTSGSTKILSAAVDAEFAKHGIVVFTYADESSVLVCPRHGTTSYEMYGILSTLMEQLAA